MSSKAKKCREMREEKNKTKFTCLSETNPNIDQRKS